MENKWSESDGLGKDLAKFNPANFGTHGDDFLNFPSQTFSAFKEPFRYIVHLYATPAMFMTNVEEHMFQLPLVGP